MFQVVRDTVSDSLVRRGLAKAWTDNGMIGLTPKGLRRLAEEWEMRRIEVKPDSRYLMADPDE